MSRFKVRVYRKLTEVTTVEVEALNQIEASRLAEYMVKHRHVEPSWNQLRHATTHHSGKVDVYA